MAGGFPFTFLTVNAVHGFMIFEPSIECTVIKVHSTKELLCTQNVYSLYPNLLTWGLCRLSFSYAE